MSSVLAWEIVLNCMQKANDGRITRIEAERLLDEYFARIEIVVVEHCPRGEWSVVTIAIAVTGCVVACNVAVVMLGYSYNTAKLRAQETAKQALSRPYRQRRCLAPIVQRTPPRTCSRAMRQSHPSEHRPKLPELLQRSECGRFLVMENSTDDEHFVIRVD